MGYGGKVFSFMELEKSGTSVCTLKLRKFWICKLFVCMCVSILQL